MDSVSLLERENEFKKLNKQLEKKTEILMKEIENAMAKKDIFADFSCNLKLSPRFSNPTKHQCDSSSTTSKGSSGTSKTLTPKRTVKEAREPKKPNGNIDNGDELDTVCVSEKQCHCCSVSPNRDLEFLYAFVSISVKDDILPQSFTKEKINVASVCKCLATKVKLLQEQIDKLKENINIKSRQCSAHMRQVAAQQQQRLRHLHTTVERQARLITNLRRQLALTAATSAIDSLEKDYNEFLTQDF